MKYFDGRRKRTSHGTNLFFEENKICAQLDLEIIFQNGKNDFDNAPQFETLMFHRWGKSARRCIKVVVNTGGVKSNKHQLRPACSSQLKELMHFRLDFPAFHLLATNIFENLVLRFFALLCTCALLLDAFSPVCDLFSEPQSGFVSCAMSLWMRASSGCAEKERSARCYAPPLCTNPQCGTPCAPRFPSVDRPPCGLIALWTNPLYQPL